MHQRREKALFLVVSITIGSILIDFFWYKQLGLFGYLLELPGLPFSMDIILVSSVYFIAGHLLRANLLVFQPNIVILIASLVGFVCVSIFTDAHTNLNERVYDNPVFATLGAAMGGVLCY